MTMKAFIAVAGVLVLGHTLGAGEVEDGFYRSSGGASAAVVKTQDGQEVRLGDRVALEIQERELRSLNNANTRFSLSLTIPYDAELGPSSYILVVSGTAYKQTGSGSSQKKTSFLSFFISGEKAAKQVARSLGAPLVTRKHPRHNLLVSFTPTEQEFAVGQEVTAVLRITNVGTNAVAFMKGGRNRAARDNQYVFSARQRGKQVEDIGSSYHHGGLAVRRVLKTGEVFEDEISLKGWFSFEEAGMYEIHGSYYLEFNDPDDDSSRTVWEDYVSADFIVTIK